MAQPLAVLPLPHGTLRIHGRDAEHAKGYVVTCLPDGREVVAAPNGDDTLAMTLAHEAAHSVVAHLRHGRASVCLTAVADRQGRVWVPERRAEEDEAHALGLVLAPLVAGLLDLSRETPDAT